MARFPLLARPQCGLGTFINQFPEPYLPAMGVARYQQAHWKPRVTGEAFLDRIQAVRVDDQQRSAIVERTAEHDKALIDERIHEGSMLLPPVLLFERT